MRVRGSTTPLTLLGRYVVVVVGSVTLQATSLESLVESYRYGGPFPALAAIGSQPWLR